MNELNIVFLPGFMFGIAMMLYALYCDYRPIKKGSASQLPAMAAVGKVPATHMHGHVHKPGRHSA